MPFTDQDQQDQKADEAGNNTDNTNADQPFAVIGDRTFQTKEDAIKALSHAKDHISKLEDEAAERAAKEQAEQRESERDNIAKEVLEQVRAESRKDGQDQDQSSNAELSKEELRSLIREEMSAENSQAEKDTNSDQCMDLAKEVYGDSANDKVAEKAKILGMSIKDVNEMAEKSPTAFKELFIPKESKPGANFTDADVSTKSLNLDNGNTDESFSIARGNSSTAGKKITDRLAASGIYDLDKQELR